MEEKEEKKEYKAGGFYQKNDEAPKEFEITYENSPEKQENTYKLMELLASPSPWRILFEGGKLGVKAIKHFFLIVFLFLFTNTILFFYALTRWFMTGLEINKPNLLAILFTFLLGLAATLYAAHQAYGYVLIDTIRVIYENLASLFQKICEIIIDKAEAIFKGKKQVSDKALANALDFGKMINEKFQKVPRFIRRGVIFIMDKIPVVGMLMELKDDLEAGNKEDASFKLYMSIDDFIQENIFGNNTVSWIWWLLPLNIIVIGILIRSQIG